jgi:hypothetical protein
VPQVGERVLVVGVGLGERVPRLLVERRVVQALRPALDVLQVAGVPVAVQPAPQARGLGRLLVSSPFLPVDAAGRFHQGSIRSQSISMTDVSRAEMAR